MTLIITCEHASNNIPAEFAHLYGDMQEKLLTHYGYDIGAAEIHAALIEKFNCHHQAGKYSRLLIDLNRTLDNKNIFSAITKSLNHDTRDKIIQDYYLPYITQLQSWIANSIAKNNPVLHISIHSFTPILNNKIRTTDIGLLYDPLRREEREFCIAWRKQLEKLTRDFKIKLNYPYHGYSNGLTSYFRKHHPHHYRGIEVELNQKLFIDTPSLKETLSSLLHQSLQALLTTFI